MRASSLTAALGRSVACVLGLLLAACTTGAVPLDPPPNAERITVLVPGYRGSFLDTPGEKPERAWISPGDVLSSGERSVALEFPGISPEPRFGPLVPTGPVTGFTVLPWVLEVPVYRPFLVHGHDALPGFSAYAYDWRRDVRESGAGLRARIDALLEGRGPEVKVDLVGHSMGGLVILSALLDAPEWRNRSRVRKVAFVGVPFRGSAGIFDDFFVGMKMGRNDRLLSPLALFSFFSSFELLPREDDFFVDVQGKPASAPVSDPEAWSSGGWSVLSDPSVRQNAGYREHLTAALEGRAAIHREGPLPEGLRALVVVGVGHATTSKVRRAQTGFDFEHPLSDDGDGSVTTASASAPSSLGAEEVRFESEHVELMRKREVLDRITAFLRAP